MNNDEDPLIAEAPLATRRQSVSPRACLLCALSLLVFACIVGAIVVPVRSPQQAYCFTLSLAYIFLRICAFSRFLGLSRRSLGDD